MKAFTNMLKQGYVSEEKGRLEGQASNTLAMGSFRKTAGIPSGCWLWQNPQQKTKKAEKSCNCLPFGAFLIICFYSIWQQTGRFWKKSGDTATLVTNHSHFSSGKSGFQFVVLELEWPGIQASEDELELVDHSSYLCRLHNPGFSNPVYGLFNKPSKAIVPNPTESNLLLFLFFSFPQGFSFSVILFLFLLYSCSFSFCLLQAFNSHNQWKWGKCLGKKFCICILYSAHALWWPSFPQTFSECVWCAEAAGAWPWYAHRQVREAGKELNHRRVPRTDDRMGLSFRSQDRNVSWRWHLS